MTPDYTALHKGMEGVYLMNQTKVYYEYDCRSKRRLYLSLFFDLFELYALATLNKPKLLKNEWRALIPAFDTQFKSLKKALPTVLNLNLPRAEQLQRRCSIVSNSFSSQHALLRILLSDLMSQCPVIKPTISLIQAQ